MASHCVVALHREVLRAMLFILGVGGALRRVRGKGHLLVLASLGVLSTWLNGGAPCLVWGDDGAGGTAVQGAAVCA